MNKFITQYRPAGYACFLLLLLSLEMGCHSNAHDLEIKANKIHKFEIEEPQLMAEYFSGNVEKARNSLQQTIEYIEQSSALDADRRAGALTLMYYRLFVLEKRAKNNTEAEIALVKARYWKVNNLKLNKLPSSEIVIHLKEDTETAEKYVDEFDQGSNGGKKPMYIQEIGGN